MGVCLAERLFAIFLKSSTPPPTRFDAEAMSCAPPRGLKRKAADDEEEESPGHLRQTVFNVSMAKLGRLRHSADPSLLRSVLVCNTLRCLERIMEREGIKLLTPSTITPSIILEPPSQQPPPPPPPPPVSSYPPPTDLDVPPDSSSDYDRYLMDLEGCSGRSTPFIRTVCDSSAFWNDDRLTSLNWSSVLNFNSSSSSSSTSSYTPPPSSPSSGIFSSPGSLSDVSLHTLMPPASLASYTNLTNSTGSTDEIFGDIDLSLYDFDVLSPISPPHVKMAPVSAEELMKCITSEQSSQPKLVQRVRT